jgi:hypothetical protein
MGNLSFDDEGEEGGKILEGWLDLSRHPFKSGIGPIVGRAWHAKVRAAMVVAGAGMTNSRSRHGRVCPGHPRLPRDVPSKTWMPGIKPGMTIIAMLFGM